MSETVTRLRATTTADRYNNAQADWTAPAELAITGCAVAPRDQQEDHDEGRQAVIDGFTVYAPSGTEILPSDRLRIRGDDHEVIGEPGVWVNAWSDVEEGVEIRTQRVAG